VKVHIKNFQSIEDVSFEIPEKAFTCIVGPSNIGKSALRRSLECLIYNKSEVSYIRNGTKTCSVEVTFEDGTSVKWYRDKKTAGYIINGEDFTKLAGSVPEVLTDRGFKELVVNKDKYQVQVASQFNNIFLLNQTGGKVTEVLSNLGNLNRIIKSNKACLSDLKSNKSRLNIRREDFVSSKEKLKSYVGLDEQRHLVGILKDTLKEIKETRDTFHKVKGIESSLTKAVSLVKTLRPSREVEVTSFDLDLNTLSSLKKLSVKYNYSKNLEKDYAPIKQVVVPELNIPVETLTILKGLLNKYTSGVLKQTGYSELKDLSEIEFNLKEEYEEYLNLLSYSKKLELAKNKVTHFKNLPTTVPDITDLDVSKLEKMSVLYQRASAAKTKVINSRNLSKDAEDRLVTLDKEREDLHKTLGVCPLCDKEF